MANRYITEVDKNGATLILPKEIYSELESKNMWLRVLEGRHSQLWQKVDGRSNRQYAGTLKAYIEKSMNKSIVDFVDGNRLNFKKSNLVFAK